jgi:hypothetical protein
MQGAGSQPDTVWTESMSALGQKRTFALQNGMSALPPKATLFASFLSFNLEQLLPMTTDEDAEILVLMREA